MKQQLNLLKRLGAHQELLDSFAEACRINADLPTDFRSDFATLLEEHCRKFGFQDILPEKWFFRPHGLSGKYQRKDSAAVGDEAEAPAIEQAYRRGVAQGFYICKQLVGTKPIPDMDKLEKKIDDWRTRSIQKFGSRPGADERPPRKLFGARNSLSNRLRWTVLKRDNFRCVACGVSASEGAVLEVDHIEPVAKGGFDTINNLQTLCNHCNSGKTDT